MQVSVRENGQMLLEHRSTVKSPSQSLSLSSWHSVKHKRMHSLAVKSYEHHPSVMKKKKRRKKTVFVFHITDMMNSHNLKV